MSLVSLPPIPLVDPVDATSSDVLDFETAALIARLALEDLDELLGQQRGRVNEAELQRQREHYQQLLADVEEARRSMSPSHAEQENVPPTEALLIAELDTSEDLSAAERPPQREALSSPPPAAHVLPQGLMHPELPIIAADLSNETNSKPSETDVAHIDFMQTMSRVESISQVIKPRPGAITPVAGPSVDRRQIVECMICYDKARYMDALSAPCGHYYCQDCTVDFAKAFTQDESLFPLRCCEGRIPITDFVPFLSDDLRMLFEEKNDEFSVPSSDRAYCANPTCSKFLGSSTSKHSITIICPDCEAITCLECKQTHEGVDCPVNDATKRLHALAQEKGWQTCPGCHALVELSIGCHHIICRCKAQFCYLCGVNWKSCGCPQFAEARLIDPAL